MESNKESALNYVDIPEQELLERIAEGDMQAQDFLLEKYKKLVKIKARPYFIIGADKEDIIQEGMIGLYKAMRDFKPGKAISFAAFAELCITRQIITALKAATRQKHIPLNSYVSLNKPCYDEESEKSFIDLLSEKSITNPEELFIGREDKRYIEFHMDSDLSSLERRVLSLYLQGASYSAMAKLIDKDEKSIDNALQRVRKKVEKILSDKQ